MVNGSRYLLLITRLLVYSFTRLLVYSFTRLLVNLSPRQLTLQISNNILIFPVLRFAVFLC